MVTRPDRDGDQQLRLLDDAWDKASQHWLDGMARQFDTGHWIRCSANPAATWKPCAS